MKRFLALTAIAALCLAIPVSQLAFAKGHVPANKTQVCHNGSTLVVGTAAAAGHVAHGDCTLPANDPNNVFFKGDPCPNVDADGDTACDL